MTNFAFKKGCSIIEVSAPVLFGMDDNIFVPVSQVSVIHEASTATAL